jgi:hypothetical protein
LPTLERGDGQQWRFSGDSVAIQCRLSGDSVANSSIEVGVKLFVVLVLELEYGIVVVVLLLMDDEDIVGVFVESDDFPEGAMALVAMAAHVASLLFT